MDATEPDPKATPIGKITCPRHSSVILRHRLFDRLDLARKTRPIVWIAGPAGSGKTTLVAGYAREKRLPCLWYQVDAGDGDVGSLFHYLSLMAKKAAPRRRNPIPSFKPEYLVGLAAFAKRCFRDLFGCIKSPGILVLDNYQDAPADSPFGSILQQGLAEIPEGINVMVLSREAPPPYMAHLRGSDKIGLITWPDLQLTMAETVEICTARMKAPPSKTTLGKIYRQSGGWAAGLVLMLEHGADPSTADPPTAGSDQNVIFDYFAGEVFQRTDEGTRRFLLTSALLPRFSAPLAQALTGVPEAGRILASLTRRNYFTLKLPGPEPCYEYHPLFRDFLLNQARQTIDSQSLRNLEKEAGRLLAQAGQVRSAAELFCGSQDWEALEKLIQGHAAGLFAQGSNLMVVQWIGAFPEPVLAQRPWLAYWLGAATLIFDPLGARTHLEMAYRGFASQHPPDRAGMFLACAAACDSFIYLWGDFTPADQWIDRIQKLMDEGPFPSADIEDLVTASMFTVLVWRAPGHKDMPLWHQRVSALLQRTENKQQKASLTTALVDYATWLGNPAAATFFLEAGRVGMGANNLSPIIQLWTRIAESVHAWITRDAARCQDAVSRALGIAQATEIHIFDAAILSRGVYGALSHDDVATAASYLEMMAQHLKQLRHLEVAHFHYLRAWQAAVQGETRTALAHARNAVETCTQQGTPYGLALAHLGLAQLLCELGEYAKADPSLDAAMAVAKNMQSLMLEYMALIIHARYDSERGRPEQALDALQQAFAIGHRQGLYVTPWWRSDIMADVCVRALENNIVPEYARDLVRQADLTPADPPVHLENWPWPLKVYTLGRFAIHHHDTPIGHGGRKAQHRPLALLKALIAFGGRDVSQARLMEALWPDADGDVAHRSFDTTLHRLRKLLGNAEVLILSDGRLSLNDRLCWVDTWAFERLTTQAEEALAGTGTLDPKGALHAVDESSGWVRKILSLYRGVFLSGSDHAWSFSLRERLQMRLQRCIDLIGRSYEAHQAWEQAADCYQKGLETDALAEVFYQRLMVCYGQLGRCAEAVAVYQRCRRELQASLHVAPTSETEAIYQSIRSGN